MLAMKKWLGICVFSTFILGCQDADEKEMPPSAAPPSALQVCQEDGDCVLVDISCNGCCERDAVNKKDTTMYSDFKARTCVGTFGAVCDCCYFPSKAICDRGACRKQVLEEKCMGQAATQVN